MATFGRTFHRDGKISPAWRGGGVHALPFNSIYHHRKGCGVRSSSEGRYTHPISSLSLYVQYSVVTSNGEDIARSTLYSVHDIFTGKNRVWQHYVSVTQLLLLIKDFHYNDITLGFLRSSYLRYFNYEGHSQFIQN